MNGKLKQWLENWDWIKNKDKINEIKDLMIEKMFVGKKWIEK